MYFFSFIFILKVALKNIFGVIPVWSVALVLGVILFLFTLFKTSLNEKPSFHWVFT